MIEVACNDVKDLDNAPFPITQAKIDGEATTIGPHTKFPEKGTLVMTYKRTRGLPSMQHTMGDTEFANFLHFLTEQVILTRMGDLVWTPNPKRYLTELDLT